MKRSIAQLKTPLYVFLQEAVLVRTNLGRGK